MKATVASRSATIEARRSAPTSRMLRCLRLLPAQPTCHARACARTRGRRATAVAAAALSRSRYDRCCPSTPRTLCCKRRSEKGQLEPRTIRLSQFRRNAPVLQNQDAVIVAAAAAVAATATAYTARASTTQAPAGEQVVDKTYSCRVWARRQHPFYFGHRSASSHGFGRSAARARERDHGERPRLSGRVQGCEEQPEGRPAGLPSVFTPSRAQAGRARPLSDGDDPPRGAPQWQLPDARQARARPLPDHDDRGHTAAGAVRRPQGRCERSAARLL